MSGPHYSPEHISREISEYFERNEMSTLVEVYGDNGSLFFREVDAPYDVEAPSAYEADDGRWYWSPTNDPFSGSTWIGDYQLTVMHSAEYASAYFVNTNIEDRLLDGESMIIGCVVVSCSPLDPEEESYLEWAWVTK